MGGTSYGVVLIQDLSVSQGDIGHLVNGTYVLHINPSGHLFGGKGGQAGISDGSFQLVEIHTQEAGFLHVFAL